MGIFDKIKQFFSTESGYSVREGNPEGKPKIQYNPENDPNNLFNQLRKLDQEAEENLKKADIRLEKAKTNLEKAQKPIEVNSSKITKIDPDLEEAKNILARIRDETKNRETSEKIYKKELVPSKNSNETKEDVPKETPELKRENDFSETSRNRPTISQKIR